MVQVTPEQHILAPTPHVPNSKLPILVYENAIPDASQITAEDIIQANKWLKGGQWKGYPVVHFHSNTHECYVVLSGNATYQLGKSPIDPSEDANGHKPGMTLRVKQGDVFVLPAGVSHAAIEFDDEYEFIGFYPEVRKAPIIPIFSGRWYSWFNYRIRHIGT